MSDIPLRTLGRSRNPRSGYTPLNTEDANGNNPQAMPSQATATNAAVSAARQNYQRWKGKKKQTYEDDPEEHEGLLGDDGSHDGEDEVGRAGPGRLHTQEARSISCIP